LGRATAFWMLAAGVLAGGCAGGHLREDREAFEAAYQAFQAGQYAQAVDGFTRYLRSCPTTPTRGEVYYYRGQALVHLNRQREARADFERAIGAEAPEPIRSFARAAIGNLYYEEGNDAKALEAYAPLFRSPRAEVPMDQVLLRTGVSLQRLGKWATADKYLQRLVETHPDTQAAAEARRRLHATGFSVQTGAFASADAAQQEAARVRAAGFTPRIETVRRGRQTLCTVQVGKVRTWAEAEGLAQRLRLGGFATVIVP